MRIKDVKVFIEKKKRNKEKKKKEEETCSRGGRIKGEKRKKKKKMKERKGKCSRSNVLNDTNKTEAAGLWRHKFQNFYNIS